MSAMEKHSKDSAALFVLVAVSLALITILSVRKLKQFKYRLINEPGGAMFYGMLLGLLVKYLWFEGEENGKSMGNVCACRGTNRTSHAIMVNSTSLQHVGKISQRCPMASTFQMGTFDPDVLFDLFLPTIIFYGAFTLNQKRLIQNWGSVLTYAFLGTLISCICIGAITTYDQMGTGHVFDPPAFLRSVGFFLGVLVGSFLLGFMFTVITALLTKFTRLHESPLLETSVFFLLSWSSFLSAEACGLSGIVAVLFCGLSQSRYTTLNLSQEGRTRTKQLFEVFNFLGEIFIFSYMGYIWFTFPQHVFRTLFILGAFLSIFISRACNIYPLSFLLNLGRINKISPAFQHFMVFSGLRGVVAFSLAIRDTSTVAKQTILTTTLLLVVFTVWVLGAAADPLLHYLDLRVEEDEAGEDPHNDFSEVVSERPDATWSLWRRLDHQYLKALLTRCGPPLTDSLPQWCGGFAKVFSSPRLQEDEEQLCEGQLDDFTVDLEKTEHASTRSDSGSEHQEDLLEGDLGIGTCAATRPEFPGVSSGSSPPPTVHGDGI